MVAEIIERSAFVFTHSYFPDDRKVIIKKSTTNPSKLLDKKKKKSQVPGKWHLDYIMFDINFTKKQLETYLKNENVTIDNNCYHTSKLSMIRYLHKANTNHEVSNTTEEEQEFVTIYGIGIVPCNSPNHLSA